MEQKLFKCAFIKFRTSLGMIDFIWWKHTPSNVMAFRNGWEVSYFDGNSISRFLMKPDLCLRSMYISVTSVVEFRGQDSTGSSFLLKKTTIFYLNFTDCRTGRQKIISDFLTKLKSQLTHVLKTPLQRSRYLESPK